MSNEIEEIMAQPYDIEALKKERDGAGQSACAACRLMVAERLEQQNAELLTEIERLKAVDGMNSDALHELKDQRDYWRKAYRELGRKCDDANRLRAELKDAMDGAK